MQWPTPLDYGKAVSVSPWKDITLPFLSSSTFSFWGAERIRGTPSKPSVALSFEQASDGEVGAASVIIHPLAKAVGDRDDASRRGFHALLTG